MHQVTRAFLKSTKNMFSSHKNFLCMKGKAYKVGG